jgi:hypothetical protein
VGPGARYPLSSGRHPPPQSTYPDEVILFFIPRPITGNPDDVRALQAVLRRNLVNERRRFLRNGQSRLGAVSMDFGKRLMNGTPVENLEIFCRFLALR